MSDKLKSQLAQIPFYSLTVVDAPAGFGKTTAVREFLRENLSEDARQYWYTCLSETPSVAWAGICDLFSNVSSDLAKNLSKSGFPTIDSIIYLSSIFKGINCTKETYLVIDNLQLINSDILQELISIFSMHGNPNLHIIIITQHLGKARITFHNTDIHTIDSSAFFFDKESISALFKMEGIRLNDDELNSVYASTEGWISALRLQISNYKQTGSFDYTHDIDRLVETAIWNRLTPEQKNCLVSLSVMESFTARQAAIMLGEDVLPDHIRDLLKHNDFIRYYPREKIYVMHSILQDYLRDQFYQYQPEAFQKRVLHTAGKCCMAESDYFNAARFFFAVRDFDAILSIPFSGVFLINNRESNIVEFIKDVINECQDDILWKYPFVLLMFAYLLRMEGEYEAYNKINRLIGLILENNPAGLSKDELRKFEGEFMLLSSFTIYNDIKMVNEREKSAYERLKGASRFTLNDIPITLGGTSVLNMFWREPGKLDETFDNMQKYLPYHMKLTNGQGVGADSVLQAEILLNRGDDVQAEILCHRALYKARSKKEICVCLCAEQILARIAILRGDADSFITALDNIKSYAKDGTNLYVLRMVDICLSVLSVALDTTDMVAQWLCDVENIRKKVYARAVPYVTVLYSHLLLIKNQHAELLGMVDDAISVAKEMDYLMPQVYSYIFKASVYYTHGRVSEAMENLEKAFHLALPDKMYLPFAQFTYMGGIISKAHTCSKSSCINVNSQTFAKGQNPIPLERVLAANPGWKKDIDNIMALYNRYHVGRIKILNALRQVKSPLTPREREVAILAKGRLTYKEIAEKLYISQATVRTILYNVYSKLDIHSKSELYKLEF